jgi:uncharacterized cupredoxin-like copper-binding protein
MRLPVLLLAALPALPACTAAEAHGAREVRLDVHWSRFSANAVQVPWGIPVRFVVHNDDPIARPTEVDVPAGATVETTITFASPGTQFFACHLPGHYAYGMRGIVTVT